MELKIDELNVSANMRSEEYNTYFGKMEISESQKKRRIRMAEDFEDEILYILALIEVSKDVSDIDWGNIQERFKTAYLTVLSNNDNDVDEYTEEYITDMSRELAESTMRGLEDGASKYDKWYATSYDRARFISENEANALINHAEEQEAIASGKTQKTWLTMRDEKVRHDHAVLERKTIPIENYFEVGASLMRFPKDYLGSPEQTVNCRCCLKYS